MSVVDPALWSRALEAQRVPGIEVDTGRTVVVVAHPDDETLGAAGLLHATRAAGGEVELVVVTDGEAAVPGAPEPDRAALATVRRGELEAAWKELGLADAPVTWLGFPDSAVAGHTDALTEILRGLLRTATTCLTTWSEDPHPDHAAVGRAVRAAAPVTAHCVGFPIWTTPWSTPEKAALPWPQVATHRLGPDAARAKRRAIERFAS
ncbi:PIG-L family deacetylase [Pseudonocardia nematodicida]|uniref:PIG-L family deacetylase n=1 Tax=Pseudonocardia nematodicida TaxID=1206997 RepID=A0ABV1KG25_9PSEU